MIYVILGIATAIASLIYGMKIISSAQDDLFQQYLLMKKEKTIRLSAMGSSIRDIDGTVHDNNVNLQKQVKSVSEDLTVKTLIMQQRIQELEKILSAIHDDLFEVKTRNGTIAPVVTAQPNFNDLTVFAHFDQPKKKTKTLRVSETATKKRARK